jgi:hypothetical protein
VLIDIADGRLSVADATGLIGVSRRQIYRLLDAFRARGADGLISRKRGRPRNRALGAVFRQTVLAIVHERCADFGPTLAAEKLSEFHGLVRYSETSEGVPNTRFRTPGGNPASAKARTSCTAPAGDSSDAFGMIAQPDERARHFARR